MVNKIPPLIWLLRLLAKIICRNKYPALITGLPHASVLPLESRELSQCGLHSWADVPDQEMGSEVHCFSLVTPRHDILFKKNNKTNLALWCCQLRNLQDTWSVHTGCRSTLKIQQTTFPGKMLYLGNFGIRILKETVNFVDYPYLKSTDKGM